MTPFEQDQLLDQVRANGNWVEQVEGGLTLDGHFHLADLRKLVQVLQSRQTGDSTNLQNAAYAYENVAQALGRMRPIEAEKAPVLLTWEACSPNETQ